ncbi:MAG: hypothetical protein KJ915_04805 [Candidatus Omnitrophica bacterium]|nr:hypothetical protein [Candidatus Omnitrophota bacterium]
MLILIFKDGKILIRKKWIILQSIFFLFFMAGCVSSANFIPADVKHHLSSPKEIKIFTNAPEFPYHVLGTINAFGRSEKDMMEALKRKAFEIGADGLIDVVKPETSSTKPEQAKGAYASSGLMWNVPKHKIGLLGGQQVQATAIQYIIKDQHN